MIILRYSGGLGNQIFQYAFQLMLENNYKRSDVKVDLNHFKLYKIHNGFELEKYFNIDLEKATNREISEMANVFHLPFNTNIFCEKIIYGLELQYKKKHKSLSTQITQRKFNSYDADVLERISKGESLYLSGEWQNWQYYREIERLLIDKLHFRRDFVIDNKSKVREMRQGNSVSIHLRRGDFVNNPAHELCGKDYYAKAISLMRERIGNDILNYYVFSDDIEYARDFFSDIDATYITSSTSIEDMQLMSMCRHHIIANSSFSFWAAFIGSGTDENGLVIAPRYFYKDKDEYMEFETPETWMKIDNRNNN